MIRPCFRPYRLLVAAVALVVPLMLDSCSSSSSKKGRGPGAPANLPSIDLHGSAATPSHSMPHEEYPFDSGGNYVTAWAQAGEAKAGRGEATSSDYDSWKGSHHSANARTKMSKPVKVSSSSKKSGSSSKTSSSSSKKKSSSKKHTVKSGDTLSSIARKYGTSVSKLKAANGLKSDMIRDGRSLSIP